MARKKPFHLQTPQEQAEAAWSEYCAIRREEWDRPELVHDSRHLQKMAGAFDRFDTLFKRLCAQPCRG